MDSRTIAAPARAARCLMFGVLTACYAPSEPAGSPCADTSPCPGDQACVAGFCRLDGEASGDPAAADYDARVPPTVGCAFTTQCRTVTGNDTLTGDAGQAVITRKGSQPAWLRLRVTEAENGSLAGVPLRVQATVTSPAQARFEVRLYVDPTRDVIECTTPIGPASNAGRVSTATAAWGEDVIANGVSDSRTVLVEVRAVSGTCSSDATWSLTLTGNPDDSSS